MSMEDRTRYFMHLPENVNAKHFEVIAYALRHDEDFHVKLSALKRLYHFKNYPQVDSILQDLKKNERAYEPYLSMALFRMERIDQEEYNRRVSQRS